MSTPAIFQRIVGRVQELKFSNAGILPNFGAGMNLAETWFSMGKRNGL